MPARARAGERPSAGALARAQCRAGSTVVTTLLGTNCTIDNDLGRQLLPWLDGQRDRETLAGELAVERAAIDETLTALARQGLLSS